VVTVGVSIDLEGKLFAQPEVHVRGVASLVDRERLNNETIATLESVLKERWSHYARKDDGRVEVDWAGLQAHFERNLQRAIRRELRCEPLLVLLLQTPPQDASPSMPQSSANGSGNGSVRPGRRRTRSTARVAS